MCACIIFPVPIPIPIPIPIPALRIRADEFVSFGRRIPKWRVGFGEKLVRSTVDLTVRIGYVGVGLGCRFFFFCFGGELNSVYTRERSISALVWVGLV